MFNQQPNSNYHHRPERAGWDTGQPVLRRAAPFPQPLARPCSAMSTQTARTECTLSWDTNATLPGQFSPLLPDYNGHSDRRVPSVQPAKIQGPARRDPYTLAQEIKNGTTEDPADNSELRRKYTTPSKLAVPSRPLVRHNHSTTMGNNGGNYQPSLPRYEGIPSRNKRQLIYDGLGFSREIPNPLWLSTTLQGLGPTIGELLNDLPISDLFGKLIPCNAGVVKITGFPWSTTRPEILSILGPKAQIVRQPGGSSYKSIHVLMERETGKTMQCFVEVVSEAEAIYLAHYFRLGGGRSPAIGGRPVQISYSSQDEFLSELFPRAKHTRWEGGRPVVDTTPREFFEGVKSVGFQGFLHPEELAYVLWHAESMERSRIAAQSPTRPFEAIISILHKYPWHTPKFIPVHERDRIYDTTIKLMGTLMEQLGTYAKSRLLRYALSDQSPALLQEMATAALVCPGFTEVQKARIVGYLYRDGYDDMVNGSDMSVELGGTHELCDRWPFLALSATPGTDIDLVKYYGKIFYDATIPGPRTKADVKAFPMGYIKIVYKGNNNPNELSLASLAKIEYEEIEALIKKVVRKAPRHNMGQANAGAQTAHKYNIAQASARARNGGGYNPTQSTADAQNVRDNQTTHDFTGVPTAPRSTYTLSQAINNAESRRRSGKTQASGMPPSSTTAYGSHGNGNNRASTSDPPHHSQGKARESLHGHHSSTLIRRPPRPSSHGDSYFPPFEGTDAAGKTIWTNFPW